MLHIHILIRGDILRPTQEAQINNATEEKAKNIDEDMLIDLIMLGASRDDIFMIFGLSEDQIQSWCYKRYQLSWEDTKEKLMTAFIPLSTYYTLKGARRGNSVAMKTLANSFGRVMDTYERELLDIRKAETEKKAQASEAFTTLFDSFLGNVNAENDLKEKERKE